jgi:anti-sigma factor RsiW
MTEPPNGHRVPHDPPDCEAIVRRLWDYVDGRLAIPDRAEVEAHLVACASCPPHFAFARRLRAAIAASAPAVTDDDEVRLRARLRRALERAAPGAE